MGLALEGQIPRSDLDSVNDDSLLLRIPPSAFDAHVQDGVPALHCFISHRRSRDAHSRPQTERRAGELVARANPLEERGEIRLGRGWSHGGTFRGCLGCSDWAGGRRGRRVDEGEEGDEMEELKEVGMTAAEI